MSTWLWGLLALLVLVQLVTPAYYLLMRWAARRSAPPLREHAPSVTVIVPAFNEEAAIRQRLKNLVAQDYPGMDVIVADDRSTDATRDIVQAFQAAHPDFPLRLMTGEKRLGKVGRVREALWHARGELICIADADSLWGPGAVHAAAARFADPNVGGVMGLRDLMASDGLAQEAEGGYNGFYNVMRLGESRLDSTPVFCGPLSMYRREFLDPERFAENALLADDSGTAIAIRRRGLRTVAEPRARFSEIALPTMSSYRSLRARRATGLQHVFLTNADVALKPWKYGWFSLIIAANVAMMVVTPVATALLAVTAPVALWTLGGLPFLAGGVAALAAVTIVPRFVPRTPLSLVAAYLETQVALLHGLLLLRRRDDPVYDHVDGLRERWSEFDGT